MTNAEVPDTNDGDTISRQAALNALCTPNGILYPIRTIENLPSAQSVLELDEWCMDCKEYDHEKNCCPRFNRVIKSALKDAQPEPKWIPCSERLPEAECGESESVLVCFENGTQDVLYFNGGNWCYPTGETYISRNYKNGWHNEVVAWMPLPDPWKGEQDEA